MDGETIDFLAKPLGIADKIEKITELAMQGERDFFESLVERVKLLKGLELSKAEAICQALPLMPGAKEAIAALKAMGFVVVCFSGGFRLATKPLCARLGIDADFANFLHHKEGLLTGEVGGEMMYSDAKGDMIVRMQSLLGIDGANTIVVGDGANDLSMFAHAETKVAFCAKEVLRSAATHTIDTKDMSQLIPIAQEMM